MCSFPAIFGHTEVIGHSPNQEAFTPPVAFGSITGTLRAALLGMSRRGGIATYLSDRDVILFRFPVNRAGMRGDERPAGSVSTGRPFWVPSSIPFQLFPHFSFVRERGE